MENNRFSEVPPVVGYMPRLRELRVTSNHIMEMPHFLSTLDSLTHLAVDHNRLAGATPSCLTGQVCAYAIDSRALLAMY